MIHPSFLSHVINGLLLFVAFIFGTLYFKNIQGAYNKLVLILLFSMAVGIHGISHLGLEKEYNYNPITKICPCMGGHKSDGHKSDGHKSDGHKSDGHKSDGHKSDGHKSDGYKSDGHKSDGHKSDGHKSDGHV